MAFIDALGALGAGFQGKSFQEQALEKARLEEEQMSIKRQEALRQALASGKADIKEILPYLPPEQQVKYMMQQAEEQKRNALLDQYAPIDGAQETPGDIPVTDMPMDAPAGGMGGDMAPAPVKTNSNVSALEKKLSGLTNLALRDPEFFKPLVEKAKFDLERAIKAEESAKDTSFKVGKETFDQENTLYKEFSKSAAPFVQVRDAYLNMETAVKDDSGPGDIQMIFGFMKSQDPNSTVREGEFATAEQAGGVSAQVLNLYNRVVDGERLTPEQREKFLNLGKKNYETALKQHKKIKTQFDERAKKYKLDPSNITFDLEVASDSPDITKMSDEELMKAAGITEEDLQ